MRRTASLFLKLALLAAMMPLASCRLYRLEKRLDPASADFLSQVSWIITRQERKVFLELPDAEKPAFIEEFWRRRDPDPDSGDNEFRSEYEKRVEEAAWLFRNESKPGWLTDRGRIFILFGPPDARRIVPSMANQAYCHEQWLYGNFPVIFIDRNCNGDFRLETHDLSSLHDFNLEYMHELGRAQDLFQEGYRPQGRLFDFQARLHVSARTPEQLAGSVLLQLPLAQMAFVEEEGVRRCVLDARLAFHDEQDRLVWESSSSPELELKKDDLEPGRLKSLHSFQLPFTVDGADKVSRLIPGKSSLQVTLTVRADGRTQQKKLELR
jgi:GWxTD domain-containing protein